MGKKTRAALAQQAVATPSTAVTVVIWPANLRMVCDAVTDELFARQYTKLIVVVRGQGQLRDCVADWLPWHPAQLTPGLPDLTRQRAVEKFQRLGSVPILIAYEACLDEIPWTGVREVLVLSERVDRIVAAIEATAPAQPVRVRVVSREP